MEGREGAYCLSTWFKLLLCLHFRGAGRAVGCASLQVQTAKPCCPALLLFTACVQGQKLSLGGAFKAGAIVSSMGKWLDRGLTAVLGGGGTSDAGKAVDGTLRKEGWKI